MIYFTSDPHFGHRTVLGNRPEFSSVDEMNSALINNINQVVTRKDTLYIIGDASFRGDSHEISELLKEIHCKKILIRGNHDKVYEPGVFEGVYDYLEIKYYKQEFMLCHYPLVCWNHMRFGSVQLHGHIHSGPEYNDAHHTSGRLQYDVGVDAHNYMPVSIDEIAAWAKSAPWKEYLRSPHCL